MNMNPMKKFRGIVSATDYCIVWRLSGGEKFCSSEFPEFGHTLDRNSRPRHDRDLNIGLTSGRKKSYDCPCHVICYAMQEAPRRHHGRPVPRPPGSSDMASKKTKM